MSFAERLRYLRRERNLTQEELAKAAGISYFSIVNYENGRTKDPAYSYIRKIADALGVSTDELQDGNATSVSVDTGDGVPTTFANWPLGHPYHVYSDEELDKLYARWKTGILRDFDLLSHTGKFEAAKRIHELTKLGEYCRLNQHNTDDDSQQEIQ
ncbi:MAG: helix-turn-helix transcriptional regulator, partial [Clostridia bacterium]|nr:helix-turn-helix transcriptional regulator [Clostridia bacterium]